MIDDVSRTAPARKASASLGRDERAALIALAGRTLRCALQPIVDVNSGVVHGVEALIRGHERLGHATPFDLLDHFVDVGLIVELEEILAVKAVDAFLAARRARLGADVRLFLNVDGRALADLAPLVLERAVRLIADAGLPPSALCVEISERYERFSAAHIDFSIHRLRDLGVKFAADDFGQGHSELKLLFDNAVDYVKIDKYFISGVDGSDRRKVFLSNMCRFAHVMGARVIAEGVETLQEFEACRTLGCDMIQGWFVDHPQLDPKALLPTYAHLAEAGARPQWQRGEESRGDSVIRSVMTRIPSVLETASIDEVIELFRAHSTAEVCVVVDKAGEPFGTIRHLTLRPLVYNRYGRDLLRNAGLGNSLRSFITACPSADVGLAATEVLDLFMAHAAANGVIVTSGGKYLGFLTADALLKLANARYLEEALDRNPLTRLPGNTMVAARIATLLAECGASRRTRCLCYFDFDNFKPFNDSKGFRQGDRAIKLFAEAIQRRFGKDPGAFFGHLGGDDFVAVFESPEPDALRRALAESLEEFAATVAGFYTEAERRQGWIECKDRFGAIRRFPLLRCSVAVVEFPPAVECVDAAGLDGRIARQKSAAKASASGISWETLPAGRPAAAV